MRRLAGRDGYTPRQLPRISIRPPFGFGHRSPRCVGARRYLPPVPQPVLQVAVQGSQELLRTQSEDERVRGLIADLAHEAACQPLRQLTTGAALHSGRAAGRRGWHWKREGFPWASRRNGSAKVEANGLEVNHAAGVAPPGGS